MFVNQSDYHMIKKVWESRNYMELNNWCQQVKAKLIVNQMENPDKTFKTTINIIEDASIKVLPNVISGYGIGKNKKESKTNAMKMILDVLLDKNLIIKLKKT